MALAHHLQRDLGVVDQVIVFPYEQGVSLLSYYEHNICRDAVWSLKVTYRKLIAR